VRVPDPTALEVIRKGAERIVQVSDEEIAEASSSLRWSCSLWLGLRSSGPCT